MIVVGGLALDSQRRALMGLRPRNRLRPSMWEYPGGKVEPGESIEQALAREWKEELGVAIEVGGLVGECEIEVEEKIVWTLYHVQLLSFELTLNAHEAVIWATPFTAVQSLPCTPTTYLVFRQVQRFLARMG